MPIVLHFALFYTNKYDIRLLSVNSSNRFIDMVKTTPTTLSLQQTMHHVPLTTILQTIAVVTYTLLCCIHCNTFSQQQFSGDLLLPSLTWCIYTTLMRMLCIAHLTHVLTIDDCGSHGHRRLLGFIQSLSFNYDCCGNLKLVLKLWSKVPN